MIALEAHGNTSRLVLADKVGHADLAELHATAMRAASAGLDVEVDLGASLHLHVSVLQVLFALRNRLEASHHHFRITAASADARHSVALAGLSSWIEE